MENITYTVMGRRGGIVADNGRALRNLTTEQAAEFLGRSIHIGTDLDRFMVVGSDDSQTPGSWFAEDHC